MFEAQTDPVTVFVSYDQGQHVHNSSVLLSVTPALPMRVGWGTWGDVTDFGWSYSCNQARIEITARYGRSMESFLYHGIERTVPAISQALSQSPTLDMWVRRLAFAQTWMQTWQNVQQVGRVDGVRTSGCLSCSLASS